MADEVIDNRYRLLELLGRGGMGEVWRAHDTRIGREVAVKIVTAGGLTDEALARFDREARIAGNMSGPSIVTVHDYGHDQYSGRPVPYLVMELVAGRTIADRVRRDGPPDPRTALHWTLQVCDALTTAHAANVVHRDIKPSNVMVTDAGTVKVLDFGIARFMEHTQTRTDLTAAGMVIGSAEYMSPEQAQGHRIDARSDLYSLGCLLFFALTGRGPFEADSPVGLAYQHVNKQAEPPSRYRVGIPAGVDALVLELLAKDPEVRPADARAVGDRIRRILGEADRGGPAAGPAGAAARQAGAAAVAGPAGHTGSTATEQPTGPLGGTGPTTAPQPVGQAGTAFSSPPLRDTEFWMPGQDTQITEVRHYPGDGQPPVPPFSPLAATVSSKPEQPSRRWFIAGATAVAVSGAGVGAWLALGHKSSSDKSSGTTDFTGHSPSSSAQAPTGSASTKAGAPSSAASSSATTAATSSSVTSSASSAPHNPSFATSLAGHTNDVAHVVFRADSQLLASCSFDHTAKLWDVSDPTHPRLLGSCEKHTDQVWNVAISPDGGTLATSSLDQTVVLWDIRDPSAPKPVTQVNVGNKLNGVAFSPDGAFLAVGTWAGTVRLIDLSRPTDAKAQYTLTGHAGLVYSVAYSPDGSMLATGSFDKTVRLWDVSKPAAAKPLGVSTAHSDRVFDLAFHPGGQLLAAGSADHSVVLVIVADPANPATVKRIAEGDEATGVAFSPDGRTLANGGGASSQVRLYDMSDFTAPHGFDPLTGHKGYTYGVAFSPDGRLLASASKDRTIRLWRF